MNDKMIFTAYILSDNQLIRVAFEHPIIEFWAEPDEQNKLKDYFQRTHFTKDRPDYIEASDLFDVIPYAPSTQAKGGKNNESV